MTDAELELARRLVAHPEWEWLGGILVESPDDKRDRAWRLVAGSWVQEAGLTYRDMAPRGMALLPDLADPATQGCLLVMLTELGHFIRYESDAHLVQWHWHVGIDHHWDESTGATLGEALARALLAAWSAG